MKGPKTLYVSDLDGTLLRHDQTVSPFTAETINTLTARGMLFSYATARSLVTAKTVTKGLNTHFPLIIYNGAFVRDNEGSNVTPSAHRRRPRALPSAKCALCAG